MLNAAGIWLILLMAKPVYHHKPVPLSGSYTSMLEQNQEIDRLNLPRITDNIQLQQLIAAKELVKIPENETITSPLTGNHRYVRPWVKHFVEDMAGAFYATFDRPLRVNSAVRTVEQQQVLRKMNRYAAPEVGSVSSSHLAGTTVDLAKRQYSWRQRNWIVSYLSSMKNAGLIEVANEPTNYHVFVREVYNEHFHDRPLS